MAPSGKSWFQDILTPFLKPPSDPSTPGTVWASHQAEQAFARGAMRSQAAGRKVRVAFRNQSKLPLILSWVAENGSIHHFYSLRPAEILEGPVTSLDHIENTNLGHSFCIAHCGSQEASIRESKQLDPKYVVGGYRPDHVFQKDVAEDDKKYIHLVTISQQPAKKLICCKPNGNLRGSPSAQEEVGNDFDDLCWVVSAKESCVDDKQIDTTHKLYEESIMGGWTVRAEPDWHQGDQELEQRLKEDLEFAAKCLPKHAREFLQKNTRVYINKNLQWGPEVCPINGRGLCFHPEGKWLEENFMTPEKAECVEIYCAKEYKEDCKLWGRAGVLVHEFSHAYHHFMCEGGYDNPDIKECYDLAMKERLYDWVRVKGPQGPMAKAYACNNCMEYFAELSAAFLGQPDEHSDEHFNKWYPFNRRQIREHDPRAYELLKKIWKV
jgi:hypothetical protein